MQRSVQFELTAKEFNDLVSEAMRSQFSWPSPIKDMVIQRIYQHSEPDSNWNSEPDSNWTIEYIEEPPPPSEEPVLPKAAPEVAAAIVETHPMTEYRKDE